MSHTHFIGVVTLPRTPDHTNSGRGRGGGAVLQNPHLFDFKKRDLSKQFIECPSRTLVHAKQDDRRGVGGIGTDPFRVDTCRMAPIGSPAEMSGHFLRGALKKRALFKNEQSPKKKFYQNRN